ncbi:Sulfotransferase [Quillaja saponaria]|uniref:Sulfotransferase n=1 Tax=Quillaja saponaria TaxID=32244 RepID=A0AAD7LRP6_QUISA|nr:Sulfotransferase [Quillaja saponaria]
MEHKLSSSSSSSPLVAEEQKLKSNDELLLSTPQAKLSSNPRFYFFQNCWCPTPLVPNVISFQEHFKAHDQDIILASKPKSGTVWLKALVFSIVNRARFTVSKTPKLTSNPHELIPFFEINLYKKNEIQICLPCHLQDFLQPTSLMHPYQNPSSSLNVQLSIFAATLLIP